MPAHEIASSDPAPRGIRCTDHLPPFQRSARVELLKLPTASHDRALGHATAPSDTSLRVSSRPSSIDQVDPFQRSISGESPAQHPLAAQWMVPTATQLRPDAQDTPVSDVSTRRLESNFGLGRDCSDHLEPFQRAARGPDSPP
jgi:hypothetical protein